MLNYFYPPSPSTISLHRSNKFFNGTLKELLHHDVIIVALEGEIPEAFYSLMDLMDFDQFEDIEIAFLGYLKRDNFNKLTELSAFCQENNIIPIIIGMEHDMIPTITDAFESKFKPHRLAMVSPFLSNLGDIDPFLSICTNEIYTLALQRHFGLVHQSMDAMLKKSSVLLHEIRKNQSVLEPFLRNAEVFYFDLNAIRHSDSPGNKKACPSGLFSEEASAICKMSGNGDKTEAFLISPWNNTNDPHQISSQLVWQLMWYFVEGLVKKKADSIQENEIFTEYIVHLQDKHIDLKFYKSEISGKWWVTNSLDIHDATACKIPCSYDEYLDAAKEKIPTRIQQLIA